MEDWSRPTSVKPTFGPLHQDPPKRDKGQRSDTRAGVLVHRSSKRTEGKWTGTHTGELSGASVPQGGWASTRSGPWGPGLTARLSSLSSHERTVERAMQVQGDQCKQGPVRKRHLHKQTLQMLRKEGTRRGGRGWRTRPGSPLNLTNIQPGGNLQ